MKVYQKSRLYLFIWMVALIFGIRCNNNEDVNKDGPLTDVDGNEYITVMIGDQVWMGENLKVTSLNNGALIPDVPENDTWNNLQTPGLCWYNNDEGQFKNIYGALYNWHTIETGKLCPAGWHMPTADEWEILHDYLGDSAASKLKETGNANWSIQNKDATNSSGFTARPGGYRIPGTGFQDEGVYGYWWTGSIDPLNNTRVFAREMNAFSRDGSEVVYNKSHGLGVRCIKD